MVHIYKGQSRGIFHDKYSKQSFSFDKTHKTRTAYAGGLILECKCRKICPNQKTYCTGMCKYLKNSQKI